VHLPINQTHIADATGLTPVHVCRTLKHMRLDKLLDFHKGQLVLFDPCRLAKIAQLDPEVQLDHPAPQGNRISDLGEDFGKICVLPSRPLDLDAQGAL
jgi:hypothetical protein